MVLTAATVEEAWATIRDHVRETPVERAPYLEERTRGEVYLKLENQQVTGSFKVRGATHKLAILGASGRARGVVAASSGNHGIAVAYGAARLGCRATVFVPEGASEAKQATMRQLGADVRVHGDDCLRAELEARSFADRERAPYVSPYNDLDVVAGQGTLAVELVRQLPGLDVIFVSLGGGGLISGVATYLKAKWPEIRVIACSPERSPAMHACLEAGRIVDVPCLDTLSDGTAGGVEPQAVTFETCRELVDESILVGEAAIADAMVAFIGQQHQLLEGAAGVALAGLVARAGDLRGKRAGVVICGANIALPTLREVLR